MSLKKITFCINTAINERYHLDLLLRSIEKNFSTLNYPFIIYVENDNQDTVGYLKSKKLTFPNLTIIVNPLPIPLGYARNINIMFERAETYYVSYLQSDMVVCPNYDLEILKGLDEKTIISSTRVEPPLHPPSPEKITHNWSLDPVGFDLDGFSEWSKLQKKDLFTDYWFAPFTLYRNLWVDIGGHDTLFRRSREDSDILLRLLSKNVSCKQSWNAIVYHFTCTSSRGIKWWTPEQQGRTKLQSEADKIELNRFYRKWNMFGHSTLINFSELYKYSISINFTHININMITQEIIEMLPIIFNKIHLYKNYINNDHNIHFAANSLLNISDENWNKYKKYYRLDSTADIFKYDPIVKDDFILNIMNMPQSFFKLNSSINGKWHNMIHQYVTEGVTPGVYQLEDNIELIVNNPRNCITDNIICKNPPIDDINFQIL